MNLFNRLCAWNDRRRARDVLQDYCEDRVKAIRALDEANRHADHALKDALRLEVEHFRSEFFGKRDPVRSAFVGRERV
jgi:hypothetical protein